ncbi:IPT/TIG domain-containing protein [Micromonospora sp. DPT]|uniref:IPT/TIG domain-containing protein n=1 Tax=Micromonospora sp. DPT TaxID=3142975 RepID=UPI0032089A2F
MVRSGIVRGRSPDAFPVGTLRDVPDTLAHPRPPSRRGRIMLGKNVRGHFLVAVAVLAGLLVSPSLPAEAAPTGGAPSTARTGAPVRHSAQASGRVAGMRTTAPTGRAAAQAVDLQDNTITFSEVPLGTSVTSQYRRAGIEFGGDSPFVTMDGANPNSPVLSGTPTFFGSVSARFVTPTGQQRTVDTFRVDVGYIDDPGSVQVVSADVNGNVIDTTRVNETGIVAVTVTKSGIAGFTVASAGDESAGFAVDNVRFAGYPFGEIPTVAEQGGADNPSARPTVCSVARPVNCASGQFFHEFDDLTVPGRGVRLSLSRTYLSGLAGRDGPFGFGWSFSYGLSLTRADDGTVTVRQENGSTVAFSPDGAGGYAPPPRVLASLRAIADGWEFYRRSDRVTRLLDADGRLTALADANGHRTTLTYDADGLREVTEPGGRTLTFGWSDGHVTSVRDPLGRTHRFAYDAAGNLQRTTDPLDRAWSFSYDDGHRMLAMTDPRGGVTANRYDDAGRVVEQADPAGLVSRWVYVGDPATAAGSVTEVTDGHGVLTTYVFANMQLTSLTRAVGTPQAATTSYGYDPATLHRTTVTDPAGMVSTFGYDERGNVVTRTDPTGATTVYSYDDADHVTAVTLPSGRITTYDYDGAGNLTAVTDPAGAVTRYAYDPQHPGDLATVTDPDGRTVRITYDGHGLTAARATTPAPGTEHITAFRYDAAGQLVCRVPASAYVTGVRCPAPGAPRVAGTVTVDHDAAGQPTAVVDEKGRRTEYGYDAHGNRTRLQDPGGDVTTTAYDPLDRVQQVTVGGDEPRRTRYTYDLRAGTAGCADDVDGAVHCTHIEAPDRSVSVEYYDADDRLVATRGPAGLTRHVRDGRGLEQQRSDLSGRTALFGYDAAGRMVSVDYAGVEAPAVGLDYDIDGRRISMRDGTGTSTFEYDQAGRLVRHTDGAGAVVSYGYDGAGNVTAISYPDGGNVARAFDGEGNLVAVTDWDGRTTRFGYDADGRLVATRYPNDVTVAAQRDAAGAVAGYHVGPETGDPLATIGYARDGNNQVLTETASAALGGTRSFRYDAGKQVVADGDVAFGYDPAGRITALPGTVLRYDGGRLTTVETAQGTVRYASDDAGRRTEARDATGATRYGYDGAGQLTSVVRRPVPTVSAVTPTSGPTAGGTVVTVRGTGLTGATEVRFGAAAATGVSVVDDTTLTAVAPAGSGTVDVRVTTPGGTSPTSIAARYTYRLAPTVTAISPTFGPATGGTTVTITGSQFTGTTVVRFGTATARYTVASDTKITAVAPAGSGTVDVRVTTPDGTSPTSTAARFRYRTAIVARFTHRTPTPVVTAVKSNAGPLAGTTVTITGRNFTRVSAVRFGTRTATFTVSSSTRITAKAPAGTGTVYVTVVTPGGTSAAGSAARYTYRRTTATATAAARAVAAAEPAAPATAVDVRYGYDGSGLRVSTTTEAGTTHSVWDVAARRPELLSDDTHRFVYGPDGLPIEQIDAQGRVHYIVHDGIGSTRMLLDGSGAVAATLSYTAYGTLASSTGTARTPFRFAGAYHDDDTGLVYLGNRYYDPETAQFLTVDPALALSGSAYGYAANNPVNVVDRDGALPHIGLAAAIGGIAGAVVGAGGYIVGTVVTGQDFSWRKLGAETAGGAVGGVVAGVCVAGSFNVAGCGAVGGAADAALSGLLSGEGVDPGDVVVGGVAGAATGGIGGRVVPLRGFEPYKMRNVLFPGKNAQRMYVGDHVESATSQLLKWILAPQPVC